MCSRLQLELQSSSEHNPGRIFSCSVQKQLKVGGSVQQTLNAAPMLKFQAGGALPIALRIASNRIPTSGGLLLGGPFEPIQNFIEHSRFHGKPSFGFHSQDNGIKRLDKGLR